MWNLHSRTDSGKDDEYRFSLVWDADWKPSGHNLAGNWKRLALIIGIDVGYRGIFRDKW